MSEQIEAKVAEIRNTMPETDLMKSLMNQVDQLVYQAYELSEVDVETIEAIIDYLPDQDIGPESLIDPELIDS